MFSAIVAMILIMTGVVLTSTLVTTEEKTSRQIYSMLNNYQLADAANLARADALQTFNYSFREKLEDYLTFNSTKLANEPGFTMYSIKNSGDTFVFDDMKSSFEKIILLYKPDDPQNSFKSAINYVSTRTIEQFDAQSGTYGKFDVKLSDTSQQAKDVLANAVGKSLEGSTNFLEVVGCDNVSCPLGTFYFNIPLNKLTDEEYEALPRIIVKDLITNEEIKMAILPRTNLKVYIPLRFFKALSEAGKMANSISNTHGQLSSYKLGFCDPGSCKVNTNPENFMGSLTAFTGECPANEAGSSVNLSSAYAGVSNYLAGGASAGASGLKAFGAKAICENAGSSFAITTGNASKFGLFNDKLETDTFRKMPVHGCNLYKLEVVLGHEKTKTIVGAASGNALRCGRVTGVYADIVYKESDPQYIVKGTYDTGQSNLYKIRIEDIGFEATRADAQIPLSELGSCTSGSGQCN